MIYSILFLMRPRHWVKNFFILIPLFFSPYLWHRIDYSFLVLGFLSFSLLSSCIYILNDICDRHSDLLHPKKKNRPIASGKISIKFAYMLIVGLVMLIGALSYFLPISFLLHLLAYGIINILYCFITKNITLLDVFSITSGFVIRVSSGAFLIGSGISGWLILCTAFISLFLAFAKRRDDVLNLMDQTHRPSLKGYNQEFLDILCTICLTCVIVFYILYTKDSVVQEHLNPDLYLTIPFVLLGVFRYLQIIFVDKSAGDPTYVVTTDKVILFSLLFWLITIFFLFYF